MAKELYTILPDDLEQLRIGPPGSNLYSLLVIGSFDYPQLPGPDYIRLLHLEPASGNPSQPRGSLQVHKLDGQCEYEAISYAWGDWPEIDQNLFLDDQILKISRNLYAALMAYSYPDRTRVIWADAICINQADNADKSQQVAIMADIYRKAKTVLAWLAPAFTHTVEAMEFMSQLASKAGSFGISDEGEQHRLIEEFPSINISDAEARDLIKDAINSHVDYLVSRPWFNRVWIVQEVTMATALIVSCGHISMDWTTFSHALEILRGAYRQIPQGEESKRVEGLKVAWALVRHRNIFRLIDQYGDRNHHLMSNHLWSLMSNRPCTDDRDRVYAMLAMTKSPYPMTPDYSKTVAEAYTDFTRKYSPVTHIHFAGMCRRQRKTSPQNSSTNTKDRQHPLIDIADRDYLPSWVPEFRPSLNLSWASPFNGDYRTARQVPFYFLPHPKMLNVMCVTGALFDYIATTSCKYDEKRIPHCMFDPDFFFSLIDQLKRIPSCNSDGIFRPESESLGMIIIKVLTSGAGDFENAALLLKRYPAFRSLTHLEPGSLTWLVEIYNCFAKHCFEPTGEVFQHVVLKALGAESRPWSAEGKIAVGFLNYLTNILGSNVLFFTFDGYIGLAPKDIRAGDFVAIFNGCDYPYVVRPAGRVKYKEEVIDNTLQVVGPCYLHGIMKGEIIFNRNAPHFSRLQWTRYDGDELDSLKGWLMLV
jgi:hypothetical protein